jgi:hypothetical protein
MDPLISVYIITGIIGVGILLAALYGVFNKNTPSNSSEITNIVNPVAGQGSTYFKNFTN